MDKKELNPRYMQKLLDNIGEEGHAMDNSKKELMMVFSQHCTFFDTEDKAKRKVDGKLVCPHCGSALGKIDRESWKEMIQNEVGNVPGYEEFMVWAQGKCFVNEQKAIEVYNRHGKKGE